MSSVEHRKTPPRQFASDNYAGICPAAGDAMAEANSLHAAVYGEDPWTRRACDQLREVFEIDCEMFFTFTFTAKWPRNCEQEAGNSTTSWAPAARG